MIAELINRFIDCMELNRINVVGDIAKLPNEVYHNIDISQFPLDDIRNNSELQIIFEAENAETDWLENYKNNKDKDYVFFRNDLPPLIWGKTFSKPSSAAPDEFRVLAIIHFYNEADCLEATCNYILNQGIDLYLLDNWSDDGSYEIALKIKENYANRVYVERFPCQGKTEYYEWYEQLKRTEEISVLMDYDWFIHYDADEMRITPWDGCTLKDMLWKADQLGYNLIDNTVIDHRLTDENDHIFMKDTYFEYGRRVAHFQQLKTWKKTSTIDLKSSGGHIAKINDPKIFPLKILNRHYPIRSLEQAEKKIFRDRKPRFEKERVQRGWHAHYDDFKVKTDFIYDKDNLLFWDKETIEKEYIALFSGCGIDREVQQIPKYMIEVDLEKLVDKKIAIYGAGLLGHAFIKRYMQQLKVVVWCDRNYQQIPYTYGFEICAPEKLFQEDFDYVCVCIENKDIQKEVSVFLKENGVCEKQIISVL